MIVTVLISLLTINTPIEVVQDTISKASIVISDKQMIPLEKLASPSSSFYLNDIERQGLKSPKMLSSIVPNLHIPDYGSSITSTIYMRGLGSRIDNPVMGLYIDDIPIMDKNAYDFNFSDIRRADIFRGPQGTLYGRNAMTGVLSFNTLSPDDINGTNLKFEGGNESFGVGGSYYSGNSSDKKGGIGVSAYYRHDNGFFTNTYNNKVCDISDAINTRFKFVKRFSEEVGFENILSASLLKQGGYPYRNFDENGILHDVNYNDYSGYERLFLLDGAKFNIDKGRFNIKSISGLQILFDKMQLDQDFSPLSLFTLTQAQRQGTFTQEVILRPKTHPTWWNHQSGVFTFLKYNNMSAPVHFKEDGLKMLILDNANAHMPEEYGKLLFQEDNLLINSDFHLITYNTAIYHESYFTFGKWLITAGLRLDHEGGFMIYDSNSELNYRLTKVMDGYNNLKISYKGSTSNFFFEVQPKLSVLYDAGALKLFGTVSKGYKSGGFNTQIFSDILQNKMKTDLMAEFGIHLDSEQEITARNTKYKPETCINNEAGFKFNKTFGEHSITMNGSVFYIDCNNQQITIFPPGKTTGRMMANVGKSYSFGQEAELSWKWRSLELSASYGHIQAKFTRYNDGNNDYSGNTIPYSPEHTLFSRVSYIFKTDNDILRNIAVGLDFNGLGKIYWNEENSLYQKFYGTLGCDIDLSFKKFSIYARAENLTGTEYNTFYFKSVGKSFFQSGKPFRATAGIRISI